MSISKAAASNWTHSSANSMGEYLAAWYREYWQLFPVDEDKEHNLMCNVKCQWWSRVPQRCHKAWIAMEMLLDILLRHCGLEQIEEMRRQCISIIEQKVRDTSSLKAWGKYTHGLEYARSPRLLYFMSMLCATYLAVHELIPGGAFLWSGQSIYTLQRRHIDKP